MKLLLDENLSWRLAQKIVSIYPDSIHVSTITSIGKPTMDMKIWEYTRGNNYTIVTYDEDFYELQALKGFPPKIVWLRFGNLSTNEILERLISLKDKIASFTNNPEVGILEVY